MRRSLTFLLTLTTVLSISTTAFAVCGDGFLESGEACDDANTLAGDGCAPDCVIEPGYVRLCSDGRDGSPTITTTTVVNTYYPAEHPTTGLEVSATAGDTQIYVGSSRAGGGVDVKAGDKLLIVQMQGADIDAGASIAVDDPYGDGAGGNDRMGYLNTANMRAGLFEFVTALRPRIGGAIPLYGEGAGGGLINTYVNSRVVSASLGFQTYQVIRVPNYEDLTISAGGSIMGAYWDGATGGVIIINASGTVTFDSGIIDGSRIGFRGGEGITRNDEVFNSLGFPGYKGEGIAGTPARMYQSFTDSMLDIGASGYPAPADEGPGAPASGGGNAYHATDAGGGGGGSGGTGGVGGQGGGDGLPNAGRGGALFNNGTPAYFGFTTERIILGGGGGGACGDDPLDPPPLGNVSPVSG